MSGTRGSRIDPSRRPFVVGLTGNFGAGKSTVAEMFRKKGARVMEADRIAHEVFRRGSRLQGKLQALFPEWKGRPSRARVARVVFRDKGRRRSLERLIHPYVFGRIREEIRRTRRPVLVVEIPLLFESGFHRHTGYNVVVKSRKAAVIRRLGKKGFSAGEVRARWRTQMPPAEEIRRADDVIDNSQGLAKTRVQAAQVWKKIERSLLKHVQGKRKQQFC